MAHLRCDYRSESMDMNTSMTVILPEGVKQSSVKVVYLLHGLADNCTGWARYTSVERYAREKGVALVIPEVQRSFYTDMEQGISYFSFIHDELPCICRNFFDFSQEPEKNYIMGLSMGGYGTLKCVLKSPGRYAGAAAFSAVADIAQYVSNQDGVQKKQFQAIFGEELQIPPYDDLFELAEKIEPNTFPTIYLACGEQDALFEANSRLAKKLQGKGANIRFEHWTGIHNWVFWDAAVRKAMDYLLGM